jgi:hypothetical protein
MPASTIPLSPIESSQLESVGYDPASKTLAIKFKRGATYEYANVPPEVHAGLTGAESAGKFFGASIKGKYDFTKMVEDDDGE